MSEAKIYLGNTTEFSSSAEFAQKYGATATRFYLLAIAQSVLTDARIRVCWRYPLPERSTIDVIYSPERNSARAAGTMKCGSAWVCPACSAYISMRRREELDQAIAATSAEWFSLMGTYTARHHANMRLDELLGKMIAAYGRVFSGRWWQDVKGQFAIQGAIRATEITYGDAGWHPHFHVIMFAAKDVLYRDAARIPDDVEAWGDLEEYRETLETLISQRWLAELEREGLSANEGIGFDLRASDKHVAEYVTKFGRMPQEWSVNASAYEVASSVTKSAKRGNFGVLDIIFKSQDDPKFRRLFVEYHEATKGKSQLHWSKGLKAALGKENIRDEIAAEGIATETDILLASIPVDFWRIIVDNRHVGQMMTLANAGDAVGLDVFLAKIAARYSVAYSW